MDRSSVDDLEAALAACGHLVGDIGDDEWALPTPCTEWTVADLVGHLVMGNDLFATAVSGGQPAVPPPAPTKDLRQEHSASSARLVDAFRLPGVLQRTVVLPLGSLPAAVALDLRIVETLVHGWDLARALGRPYDVPDDLAARALDVAHRLVSQISIPSGRRPFAPPQPVSAMAPAVDRLAAFLGRPVA